MKTDETMWDLELAIDFVRGLEKRLSKVGFHVGLIGSVLMRGESTKDLDIVVYPKTTGQSDIQNVYNVFVDIGMDNKATHWAVMKEWQRQGVLTDHKHVEVWRTRTWKRVDVFFLR